MTRKIVFALLATAAAASAQAPAAGPSSTPTGRQISGLPALNFNADEGFGYGVIAQAYNYGQRGAQPYEYMIQPLIFLTTKGRRDFSVFLDEIGRASCRERG